jgi:hypothetical protein
MKAKNLLSNSRSLQRASRESWHCENYERTDHRGRYLQKLVFGFVCGQSRRVASPPERESLRKRLDCAPADIWVGEFVRSAWLESSTRRIANALRSGICKSSSSLTWDRQTDRQTEIHWGLKEKTVSAVVPVAWTRESARLVIREWQSLSIRKTGQAPIIEVARAPL